MPTAQQPAPSHRTQPAVTRAFVLGAGLGTRLQPLTDQIPKPLVPVANRPLITHTLDRLIEAGIRQIAINTHHLPEAYAQAFPDASYRDIPLLFRHEPDILDTGGGIKNMADFFGDDPFLVHNGDIFSTLPLTGAIARHLDSANDVTLLLRSGGGPLEVAFDPGTGKVNDIGRRLDPHEPGTHLFTGISVAGPTLLERIPSGEKISLIPILVEMIQDGLRVGGIALDEGDWWDIGTVERYLGLHQHLADGHAPGIPSAPWIDPEADIHRDALILGHSAIGPDAQIGADAVIDSSVLWARAKVRPGSRISDSVLLSEAVAGGDHCGTAIC